jgi:peptidoglycan/LPS O-acetylase OafA/YrhL
MIIGLYLLHPWLRRLFRKSQLSTCLAAFALQLWGWPLAKANGLPEGAITTLLSFMAMLGYFVAGYFILDHAKAAWWLCERWAGRVACSVIWLFYPSLNRWLAAHEVGWPIRTVLAVASMAAAFFVLTSVSVPKSRLGQSIAGWSASFGLYSFGVYLVHPLVISAFSRVVTRLTGLSSGEPLWGLLVFTLTAPAALGLVKWLANRPLGRYFT